MQEDSIQITSYQKFKLGSLVTINESSQANIDYPLSELLLVNKAYKVLTIKYISKLKLTGNIWFEFNEDVGTCWNPERFELFVLPLVKLNASRL